MKKKLYLNTVSSLLNQIVALVCGFILPRFILQAYGSEVNGIVSSITQFLSIISLLDLGVGAVIQSAYYKPLAEQDNRQISLLFNQSKSFFRLIAIILVGYVALCCVFYPRLIETNYSHSFTISLIIIISISLFSQYYFSVPHQLLLNADQHLYVQSNLQIITVVLNTIICVVLIQFQLPIQIVKLASSIIYLLRPICLTRYVNRHYAIDVKLKDPTFKIEQKWNGLAQHCATVVMNNTDVIILSMFSSMENVSVYSVYFLVVNGIKQLINALSNGFYSLFGNLLVCKERELLKQTFNMYEWLTHTIVVFTFSVTGVLLVPFVANYTYGITDAQYIQPKFAVLMTLSQALFCIRIPYNTIVCSAGHYKQTQSSALVEMMLNIGLSVLLVKQFGLNGIAFGTLIALGYRSIYFVRYLCKNILSIRFINFVKLVVTDVVQALIIVMLDKVLCELYVFEINYIMWLFHAVLISTIAIMSIATFNIVFFKQHINELIHYIRTK